jgi:hypothetical protein
MLTTADQIQAADTIHIHGLTARPLMVEDAQPNERQDGIIITVWMDAPNAGQMAEIVLNPETPVLVTHRPE